MADLLDLGAEDAAAKPQTTTADDLAAAFGAPAAATAASTVTPPAAKAAATEDDWGDFGGFQAAGAAAGGSSASAAFTAAAAGSPSDAAVAATAAGGSPASASVMAAAGSPASASVVAPVPAAVAAAAPAAAGLAVDNFDPLASPAPVAAAQEDPFTNLEAIEKKRTGDDALISMGALDEFDPVAQSWAQKEAATSVQNSASAAAVDPLAAPPPAPVQSSSGGDDGDLLGLGGGASTSMPEVEELDKKMIYVYHKGEKNCVGWYSDMKAVDIKEAILCACDAIMDGGFVLREVELADDGEVTEPKQDGRIFEYEEFDKLQNGQTYLIEAAGEREDLKKITGDRFRRLKVQIDPLLHVEAVKAIDRMRRGSNLLKHTHYGFPHLRQFQLSDDKKRLVWYSGAKKKEDSVVYLEHITEIKLGQQTPTFLHYRLPMLEHLSFSLVYAGARGTKTLDVTCKDEFEFDHWITGLKAIFYHLKNKQISKEQLLQHSKRFVKAVEKNNAGIKLTKLPEVKEKGHVGLDDCIEIVAHTPQQLDSKMDRLRDRLKTMSQQVSRLDDHSTAEMEVDLSLLTGQGPAYASVFAEDEDAQDEEMEIRRMHELVEQTTQILQQARNELVALHQQPSESSGSNASAAKNKKKEAAACKHIDQLLWKAEVDLENVEDMYVRHVDNQRETYSLADFNQQMSKAMTEVEESINDKLEEIKSFFW